MVQGVHSVILSAAPSASLRRPMEVEGWNLNLEIWIFEVGAAFGFDSKTSGPVSMPGNV